MKQFVCPNQISVKAKFKIPAQNLHNDPPNETTQSVPERVFYCYTASYRDTGNNGGSYRFNFGKITSMSAL